MKIGEVYQLKDGKYGSVDSYNGAVIEKFTLPHGQQTWSMEQVLPLCSQNSESLLAEKGQKLGGRSRKGPLLHGISLNLM